MEVSQLSARQENVRYGDASLPTFAHLVPVTGHAPIKEEVFETDLLGSTCVLKHLKRAVDVGASDRVGLVVELWDMAAVGPFASSDQLGTTRRPPAVGVM